METYGKDWEKQENEDKMDSESWNKFAADLEEDHKGNVLFASI
jgi:hypothetical protein